MNFVKMIIFLQTFSLTAAEKTEEIAKEAEKADKLLYQILPRSVAKKLLKGKPVRVLICLGDASHFISISGSQLF